MFASRRSFATRCSALTLLGVLAIAPGARAQGANAATAQALFDEAKALMAAGRAEQACPKFAESQKLDPGLGTLVNLAACYEKTGKLASAWSTFLEAESAARADGSHEGVRVAQERAAALAPKLSKLKITVVAEPPGLEIQRDGVPVGQAQWGLAVPADPGPHTIVATAPERVPFRTEVTLSEPGATVDVAIPELAPARVAPTTPDTRPPEPGRPKGLGAQHYVAIGAGVIGLAGVAVGTVFGLQSMSKGDEADEHCDGGSCRVQEGVELREDARTAGNISTIGFIVGGVGLAGGAVLWFTASPSRSEPQAGLVVGPGRVAVRGTF
jgi:hypothetical protein